MKKFSTILFVWLGIFFTTVYSGERKPDRLLVASLNGRTAEVKSLLQGGAKPNPIQDPRFSKDLTPLVVAVLGGHVPVVNVLLKHGADPNEGRYVTPLIALANAQKSRESHNKIIDCFVRADADVNKPNSFGVTLCMLLMTHEKALMKVLGWHLVSRGGICPPLAEMKKSSSSILLIRGFLSRMTKSARPGVDPDVDRLADVQRTVAKTDHAEQLKGMIDKKYPEIRSKYLSMVAGEKTTLRDVFIPKYTDREISEELLNLILSMNRGEEVCKKPLI